MNKYDIFISYRRKGGFETAKHLNDLLTRDGYRVSFDIDSLRSGDFDVQLYERIDQCRDFIIIVDQNAFDRTISHDLSYKREEDWLRCELAYALQKNKNVIPVFLSGVNGFPPNLPADLIKVLRKNGPEYGHYHFNAFYKDLKKRFIQSLPVRKMFLYSISVVLVACIVSLGIIIGGRSKKPLYPENSIENASVIYNDNNVSEEKTEPKEEQQAKQTIEPEQVIDDRRHMEFAGIPMNTDIDRYAQSLKEKGYETKSKTTEYYQMISDNDTIFVFYDKQNKNNVMGVTLLEGGFTTNDIGDLVMGFVESIPGGYEDFTCLDDYGCIVFSHGKIVIGENINNRGTLVFQFVDNINTQGYKLWHY